MTVLAEDDLQISLPATAKGRKFDDEVTHRLSHCMKAVDFIVELKDRVLFIEFKESGFLAVRVGGGPHQKTHYLFGLDWCWYAF